METNLPTPHLPWPGRHVAVPGASLWTVDSGGTGTPLVLLHANTGTAQSWQEQFGPFCAAGYRVIAFDRRGWGRSETVPGTGEQPGSVAEDLDALAGQLGLARFHLLGIAGGGFVALDYAAWRPERVLRLAICASNGRFTEPGMQAFYERIAVPGLTGRHEVRPWLEVGAAYRAENPEGFARFCAMEHNAQQAGAPAQPLRTPNTFSKIAAIPHDTLVLMGGADLLAPPALMRAWARHLPRTTIATIPDGGHSLNWERPREFNDAVLRFLASPLPTT
ncbi:alpha/beta fold hydrolase [Hydrogenophaga sp. BPS33]|uniref:alpha/beta fold hydrolase n=1 Tax=Hydrogenophaga sp. BPS33 TaxID=2651974 RepID=UPI00131FAACF|nr:alpha/beta hydrolase [Hydrogenophaga sp. BPS33]QHE88048.1 alpha/beta hydrolase [Hydrogenophaga sp. BPS33]